MRRHDRMPTQEAAAEWEPAPTVQTTPRARIAQDRHRLLTREAELTAKAKGLLERFTRGQSDS